MAAISLLSCLWVYFCFIFVKTYSSFYRVVPVVEDLLFGSPGWWDCICHLRWVGLEPLIVVTAGSALGSVVGNNQLCDPGQVNPSPRVSFLIWKIKNNNTCLPVFWRRFNGEKYVNQHILLVRYMFDPSRCMSYISYFMFKQLWVTLVLVHWNISKVYFLKDDSVYWGITD